MKDFDWDEAEIVASEYTAVATLAVIALQRGQRPPMDTPLERTLAGIITPMWQQRESRIRRARIAELRARTRAF